MRSVVSAFCLLFMTLPAVAALEAGQAYDNDMVMECASFEADVVTTLRLNKSKLKKGSFDISLVREAAQLSTSPRRTSRSINDLACSFKAAANALDSVSCSRNENHGDNVTTSLSLNKENTLIVRTSGMHDDTLHALMKDAACDLSMENFRAMGIIK